MIENARKEIDLQEFGQRCAIVRKRLGMTQVDMAKLLGTSQYQISRMEGGGKIMSPLMLKVLVLFSKSMSLDKLLAKDFDAMDENILNTQYALNSVVKAKLDILKEELLKNLTESVNEVTKQIEEASELL